MIHRITAAQDGRQIIETFKKVIRKAYGFRNIQNMMDMVCSNIRVPLPNRKPKVEKSA